MKKFNELCEAILSEVKIQSKLKLDFDDAIDSVHFHNGDLVPSMMKKLNKAAGKDEVKLKAVSEIEALLKKLPAADRYDIVRIEDEMWEKLAIIEKRNNKKMSESVLREDAYKVSDAMVDALVKKIDDSFDEPNLPAAKKEVEEMLKKDISPSSRDVLEILLKEIEAALK